jgi:hypothetical protein
VIKDLKNPSTSPLDMLSDVSDVGDVEAAG